MFSSCSCFDLAMFSLTVVKMSQIKEKKRQLRKIGQSQAAFLATPTKKIVSCIYYINDPEKYLQKIKALSSGLISKTKIKKSTQISCVLIRIFLLYFVLCVSGTGIYPRWSRYKIPYFYDIDKYAILNFIKCDIFTTLWRQQICTQL